MKKYIEEFLKRGIMCAAGGPLILATIYGILGASGVVDSLSPQEVCTGTITVTLMAFIAAGITSIYHIERLPLISAILIHCGVLYLDYLIIYLLNSWIPRNWDSIGVFTAVFVAGYAVIWALIYLSAKCKTERINKKMCH